MALTLNRYDMGSLEIRHKMVTLARRKSRASSDARISGRSIFIKRYPGKRYKLIAMDVSKKQRALRDMFADAQKLAQDDMKSWNRVRHWERYARKHKKRSAYRGAVSFYYKMLREHGEELREVVSREATGRKSYGQSGQQHLRDEGRRTDRVPRQMSNGAYATEEDMRIFREGNIFFWVRFDSVEEYREELMRLAA